MAISATSATEAHVKRPYVYVFLALAVVTLIEVWISQQSFPTLDRISILVVLATFKASLVVAYYMHLKYEPRWMLLIPFGALALVFVLVAALTASSVPSFPQP